MEKAFWMSAMSISITPLRPEGPDFQNLNQETKGPRANWEQALKSELKLRKTAKVLNLSSCTSAEGNSYEIVRLLSGFWETCFKTCLLNSQRLCQKIASKHRSTQFHSASIILVSSSN